MVGIGNDINNAFNKNAANRQQDYRKTGTVDRTKDRKQLVKMLLKEKLVEKVSNRCHRTYPNLTLDNITAVPRLAKLHERLNDHTKRTAYRRSIAANSSQDMASR